MKNSILLLFLFFLSSRIYAQIEIRQNGIDINSEFFISNIPSDTFQLGVSFYIHNLTSDSIYFGHERTRLLNVVGWHDQISDDVLAWDLPDVDYWEAGFNDILIPPGDSSVYKVFLAPNSHEGCGIYQYKMKELNSDTTIASFKVHFSTYDSSCFLNTYSQEPSNFEIYPNPVQDVIHIKSDFQYMNIEIQNLAGQIIFTGFSETGNPAIDLASISPGTYFIVLRNKNGSSKSKLIIVQ